MKKKYLLLSLIAATGGIFYFVNRDQDQPQAADTVEVKAENSERPHAAAERADPLSPRRVQPRSPQEVSSATAEKKAHQPDNKLIAEQERIEKEGYGTFPAVELSKMNPHKRHVLEALKDPKNNSGAISITGKREKFDLAQYNSRPDYYLGTVEPGRAFDAAQPAEGVKPIKRIGSNYYETIQNKSVELAAIGEFNMPMSFTAFDGGEFENGLAFITVKTNSQGIATVKFTPTTGVINQCRIRAASPVNSNTLSWIVYARLAPAEAK